MTDLSYLPLQPWYCRFCARVGSVSFSWREKPDLIWDRIVADHAERSPVCAEEHGGAFVEPIKIEQWSGPE